METIVFFPGCMPISIARHQYRAERKLLKKLDIPFIECPEFSCCGGGHLQDADEMKFLALNARNLVYAERHGRLLVTGCSTCYQNLVRTAEALKDETLRSRINRRLNAVGVDDYRGIVEIRHMLNFLASPEIFSLLENLVIHRKEQNIMPFYGCHIKRPSTLLPENPDGNLEKLLTLCGAFIRPMRDPYVCCGFHGQITSPKTSNALTDAILNEASEQQCETIVTVCPLCAFNIESRSMQNDRPRPKIVPVEEMLLRSMRR